MFLKTLIIMLNNLFLFSEIPVLLNVRSSYSSAFFMLNSGFPLENSSAFIIILYSVSKHLEILVSCSYLQTIML